MSADERAALFAQYFSAFPWAELPADAQGFDAGCGSGRWAAVVADRVGRLHCVDASATALEVARRTLASAANCMFHLASVSALPFENGTMDFGYSLGVLHHTPDPADGLRACVSALKPGAPFLLYLYYRFDNRPLWFRLIWEASNLLRVVVSRLPKAWRFAVCDVDRRTRLLASRPHRRACSSGSASASNRFRCPTIGTAASMSCATMRSIGSARGWNGGSPATRSAR